MLKQDEVVFYTEQNFTRDPSREFKLLVGMTKHDSIEASRIIEIIPLMQQSESNLNDWVVDTDAARFKNIGKNNIFYIVKNKQILRVETEGNFLVSIDGKSVEKIFEIWSKFLKDPENGQELKSSGKMLRKRKKRKKAGSDEDEEERDFEEFLARKKYKIGRERQLEILPSFRKIASTNLRFGKEKDENGEILFDFGSSRKKKIRKRRKLSLSVIEDKSDSEESLGSKKSLSKVRVADKIHFIEYLQDFLPKQKIILGLPLKSKVRRSENNHDLFKKFSYLDFTKENILSFYEEIRSMEEDVMEGEVESLGMLNQRLLFTAVDYSVRLIMTFNMPQLHSIRDDLFIKNPEKSVKSKMESLASIPKKTKNIYKGLFVLENVLDFIQMLAKNLEDSFHSEYFEFIQKFCFLIIDSLEEVTQRESKRDHKRSHLIKIQIKTVDFNFRLFKVLFDYKGTEKIQLNILSLIISQIKTSNSFSIQGNQPLIAKRLNKFYNDKLNQTPKKWNIFVDACVEVITNKRAGFSFEEFFKDYQKMEYFTGIMLSIQTSLAKGYYTGLMRVVIQRYIEKGDFSDLKKKQREEGEEGQEAQSSKLEKFMLELLGSNEKLPIFVFFARCIQHYYGDLKKIAGKHEMGVLEVFTQRFMTEDEQVQVEDFKYIPLEYRQYVDGKKRLNYLVQANKDKELVALVCKNLSGFEEVKYEEEKESVYVERYNFWLIFLNEFYTSYLVDQQVNFREGLKNKIKLIREKVDSKDLPGVSKKHFKFLMLLLNNFGGSHYLSLCSSDSKEMARKKITIAHTMLILILTRSKLLGVFSDSDVPYFKRGQLAAYPSKKEISLLLIANTFNNLSGEWRTGQQFTRLYRCSCSYLYWIGDCGRAWVIAKCPNCKMDIGGEKHKLVNSEKGGKEITKDIFFKSMYGPLEKKSEKIYHLRIFGGKYEKVETGYSMEIEDMQEGGGMVIEGESKQQEKDNEKKGEELVDILQPDKGDSEEVFEVEKGKPFTPLRGMDKICIFSISEFIGHCRYLLEILVSPEEVSKEQDLFFALDGSKHSSEEYIFDILNSNYKLIKADEWSNFNPEQYFRALNILIESSIGDNLKKNPDLGRNDIEKLIRSEYEDKKDQIADYVVQRIQLKKNFDRTMSSTTKLTKDWMSNLVALDDFKGTEIDLKLVSGMRMQAKTNLEKFKDWLKIHIQRENLESEGLRGRMKFVKKVIELKEILRILKGLIGSHIEFCQLIRDEFEFRLSYKQACSISIHELLQGKVEEGESDEGMRKAKEHFVSRFTRKEILREKYKNLADAWKHVMKYREEYADLFNFRFLCHAQELPEKEIEQIFDPRRARLIYFIPSAKYVESLFMSSALPTLSKIQNDFVKSTLEDFFRANFCKPKKVPCLQIDSKNQLIAMERTIDYYLDEFTYTDLTFNKDFQVVYDIDLMAKAMSRDLMRGVCLIECEGDTPINFSFGREMASIYENIKKLEIQRTWEWNLLEKKRAQSFKRELGKLDEMKLFEYIAGFGKKIQSYFNEEEADEKNNQLSFKGFVIDELANKMNKLKIKRGEIKEFYHLLEKASVKFILENPLPQFKVLLTEEKSKKFNKFFGKIDKQSKARFEKMAICLYLTRIVGTTNENIGEIGVNDCMTWSGILDESEEDIAFLSDFDADFMMNELCDILKRILV